MEFRALLVGFLGTAVLLAVLLYWHDDPHPVKASYYVGVCVLASFGTRLTVELPIAPENARAPPYFPKGRAFVFSMWPTWRSLPFPPPPIPHGVYAASVYKPM